MVKTIFAAVFFLLCWLATNELPLVEVIQSTNSNLVTAFYNALTTIANTAPVNKCSNT